MLKNITLKEGRQISWFPEGIFVGTDKYTFYIFILGMDEEGQLKTVKPGSGNHRR
jgi:hypothetical protein